MATTTTMIASKAKTATATVLTCFLVEEGSRQVTTQTRNFGHDRSFLLFLPSSLAGCWLNKNFIPLWIISLQSPRPKTREIAGHKPRRVKLSQHFLVERLYSSFFRNPSYFPPFLRFRMKTKAKKVVTLVIFHWNDSQSVSLLYSSRRSTKNKLLPLLHHIG